MASMNLMPLCTFMDELAWWTWDRMVAAASLDASFGEVAITEHLLFDLKVFGSRYNHGYKINIEQISQQAEGRSGADFEIWLEVESGRYFAYSIQAKRLDIENLTYPKLSHHGHPATPPGIAADPAKPLQYDTLIAHALKHGTTPMHLLYNGWGPRGDKIFESPPDEAYYGCAVIPTVLLKSIRESGKRRTNKVLSYSEFIKPWSTLFRWPWQLGPHDDSLGDPGAYALNNAMNTDDWYAQVEIGLTEGLYRANPFVFGPIFDSQGLAALPDYVHRARDAGVIVDDSTLPRYVVIIEPQIIEPGVLKG